MMTNEQFLDSLGYTRKTVFTTGELVAEVRRHALANYTKGGWDVIVECWDDTEIAEVIGRSKTVRGALRNFSGLVSIWADRQADAVNSAF